MDGSRLVLRRRLHWRRKTEWPSQKGEDSAYAQHETRLAVAFGLFGSPGFDGLDVRGAKRTAVNESSVRSPHVGLVFGVMSPQGDWAQRFSPGLARWA